jgi:hypothetical protein
MPISKEELYSEFYNCFSEVNKLYEEVKEIVLLAEYENKEQKYLITSVNELRNALDHLMRSINDPESLKNNIEKSKGHLYRAGYDAYEILAISKLNEIRSIKEHFSYEAILEAYPDYHKRIIPCVKKAKDELAYARAHKKIGNDSIDPDNEKKHFENFEMISKDLIDLCEDINLHIEGINEAHKNKRRNDLLRFLFKILAAVIASTIVLYIGYKFFDNKRNSQTVPVKIEVPSNNNSDKH